MTSGSVKTTEYAASQRPAPAHSTQRCKRGDMCTCACACAAEGAKVEEYFFGCGKPCLLPSILGTPGPTALRFHATSCLNLKRENAQHYRVLEDLTILSLHKAPLLGHHLVHLMHTLPLLPLTFISPCPLTHMPSHPPCPDAKIECVPGVSSSPHANVGPPL